MPLNGTKEIPLEIMTPITTMATGETTFMVTIEVEEVVLVAAEEEVVDLSASIANALFIPWPLAIIAKISCPLRLTMHLLTLSLIHLGMWTVAQIITSHLSLSNLMRLH